MTVCDRCGKEASNRVSGLILCDVCVKNSFATNQIMRDDDYYSDDPDELRAEIARLDRELDSKEDAGSYARGYAQAVEDAAQAIAELTDVVECDAAIRRLLAASKKES